MNFWILDLHFYGEHVGFVWQFSPMMDTKGDIETLETHHGSENVEAKNAVMIWVKWSDVNGTLSAPLRRCSRN